MNLLHFAAIAVALSASAASDEPCKPADVPAIVAKVHYAEDQGVVLGRYASRDSCFEAWASRLRRGLSDDGKHLACVTRVRGTELRALDFKTADALCLQINVCLFDLFDRGESDPANQSLTAVWDRLSCDGH